MGDQETKTSIDEFRFITGKKKIKRKIHNGLQSKSCINTNDNPVDEGFFLRRLKNVRDEIKISKYFTNSVSVLKRAVLSNNNNNKETRSFVCFGLGSFTTCLAALHQFAFSLEICDYLKISHSEYYDPIFSKSERNILRTLNCDIMSKNCEGKYTILGENYVLLYLPHCPKQLINNFLWHNWDLESLQKTILICNSFEKLIINTPERILQEEAQYVKKIGEFMKEFPLENYYQYQDIFNDTSIHILGNCGQFEMKDFWKKTGSPQYSDIELIIEKIETRLNI